VRYDVHPSLRASRPRQAIVGGAIFLLIVLVVIWASTRGEPGAATPTLATTTCLPFTEPTNLAQLNEVVGGYRANPGFRGGDVGASTRLQDGRELYVFGDTLRAPGYPGGRFVRNSMLVFSSGCAGLVESPDHGAIIPDRPDGVGYWPMSIAAVNRGSYDLVGVMAQRVKTTGPTESDFENLGPSIALFRVDRGATPQLLHVVDLEPDDPSRQRPTWGAAGAMHGGWLYLYGTSNPEKPLVFGWSLSVARMRIDDVTDMSRWQFWDGHAWQKDASKAATLIPAVGGVSQTLSVVEQHGTWYAISKRDDFLGSDLVVWSSPTPEGPFTAGPALAHIPSSADGTTLRYMPLAHPDLLPKDGTMVVSVSRNSDSLALIDQDPTRYRPYFLRIRLRPSP